MSVFLHRAVLTGCAIFMCLIDQSVFSNDLLNEQEMVAAKQFSRTHIPVYVGTSWTFVRSIKGEDGTLWGQTGHYKEIRRLPRERIYYGWEELEGWEFVIDENTRKSFSIPQGYELSSLWTPSIALLIPSTFTDPNLRNMFRLYHMEKKEFLSEFLIQGQPGDYPRFVGLEITKKFYESEFEDKEEFKKSEYVFFDVESSGTKRLPSFKDDKQYYYFGAGDGVIAQNILSDVPNGNESRFLCDKHLNQLFRLDIDKRYHGWEFLPNSRNSFNSTTGIVSDDVILIIRKLSNIPPFPLGYGAVDKKGRYLFKNFRCTRLHSFHDGVARFERDGLIGYIDKKGKEIVPAKYLQGTDFHEGCAFVLTEEIKEDPDAHPLAIKETVNRTYKIKTDGTIVRQQWNPCGYLNSLHHGVVLIYNPLDGDEVTSSICTLDGEAIINLNASQMKKLLDSNLIE